MNKKMFVLSTLLLIILLMLSCSPSERQDDYAEVTIDGVKYTFVGDHNGFDYSSSTKRYFANFSFPEGTTYSAIPHKDISFHLITNSLGLHSQDGSYIVHKDESWNNAWSTFDGCFSEITIDQWNDDKIIGHFIAKVKVLGTTNYKNLSGSFYSFIKE